MGREKSNVNDVLGTLINSREVKEKMMNLQQNRHFSQHFDVAIFGIVTAGDRQAFYNKINSFRSKKVNSSTISGSLNWKILSVRMGTAFNQWGKQ